jgi:hypothetical protein
MVIEFILFAVLGLADSVVPGAEAPTAQETGDNNAELRDKWGIEITALRRAAAGHMLDFRFRVLDADKAAPLFVRKTKPSLLHENTGLHLVIAAPPKVGALRSSNPPIPGRIYFMFFGNPNGFVKPGDRVTITIGDFRAENLTVQ